MDVLALVALIIAIIVFVALVVIIILWFTMGKKGGVYQIITTPSTSIKISKNCVIICTDGMTTITVTPSGNVTGVTFVINNLGNSSNITVNNAAILYSKVVNANSSMSFVWVTSTAFSVL